MLKGKTKAEKGTCPCLKAPCVYPRPAPYPAEACARSTAAEGPGPAPGSGGTAAVGVPPPGRGDTRGSRQPAPGLHRGERPLLFTFQTRRRRPGLAPRPAAGTGTCRRTGEWGKHSGPAGGPAGLRGRGRRGGCSPPPSPALRRWFPSAAPARPALTLLAAAAAGGGRPAAARPPSPRLRIEVAVVVVGDVRAGGSASSWGRRRLSPAPPPLFRSQS